jgi:PAS domain S-box-containing protein
MMRKFRHLSLQRKQMLIIMLTSTVALLLACAAFVSYDALTYRRELVVKLSSLAEVVGNNTTAALDFNDPAAADQTLAALRGEPNIMLAHLYQLDGKRFATYTRTGTAPITTLPLASGAHHEFTRDYLWLLQPVTHGGEQIGTIELVADLGELYLRWWRYAGIVALVFGGSLVVAFSLSLRLGRVISRPVRHLAEVVQSVARDKNYSVRATKQSENELGQLVDGFNAMLAQIQERDAALQSARDHLERRVEARTEELAGSLSLLNATLDAGVDGIIAIDFHGKVTCHNAKFVDLWRFPEDVILRRDIEEMIPLAAACVKDPAAFTSRVREMLATPAQEAFDILEFNDGRVIERLMRPQFIGDQCVGNVFSFRDITERKRAEITATAFSKLGRDLSCAASREDAAQIISEISDDLFGWDAFSIHGYSDIDDTVRLIFEVDTIDGLRSISPGRPPRKSSELHRRIFTSGAELILRDATSFLPGAMAFGNVSRPSASLMFAPIRTGSEIVGILSIQSYTPNAYTEQNLGTLQMLADHCGGALKRIKADEALRESQALYDSLVEHLPAGVFRKDCAGNYVFANSMFCRLKGRTAEEIIGKNPQQLAAYEATLAGTSPAEAQQQNLLAIEGSNHHELILRTGQPIEWEETYPQPDGTMLYFQAIKSPVFATNRTIIGTQGILFDVSARKRAEAELAYERDLLRTLLDNSTDNIYFKDRQSRFIKASSAQAAQFGFATAMDLVGKTDFDFFAAEHAGPAFEDEQEIIRTGQPLIDKVEKEVMKDGRMTWALTTKMPLRNNAGVIIGTFGISKNITGIKETEAQLVESKQFLQSTLDALSAHIAILDETGTVIAVNAMWKNFADRNKFLGGNYGVGANYLQLCDSASGDCATEAFTVAAGIRSVLARKDAEFHQEYPCHDPEEERWFVVRITRFESAGPVRVVVAHENVTERKRAEAELQAAHQELLEVSRQAGMAEVATAVLHNVGNVLNSVNVGANYLADSLRKSKLSNLTKLVTLLREHAADLGRFLTDDPKGRMIPDYLTQLTNHLVGEQTMAQKELTELQQHIDHIKTVVTMQQSFAKVSGVVEVVPVPDLVEAALRMNVVPQAGDIKIVKEFAGDPTITVEKQKVLQILVNLLRNARQACDEAGHSEKMLTIRTTQTEDRVRIAIADNGVGIRPENLTRIFAHGFTTKKNGHGFGLHSGALAAKEMGGSLSVQSNGPGQGATFTLELPTQPASLNDKRSAHVA